MAQRPHKYSVYLLYQYNSTNTDTCGAAGAYLADYVDKMRYYKLPLVSQVDNTDQRIAEDISNFCDKAVSLFCTCIVSLCDLVVFSVILYNIYPPLFGVLLLYAAVHTRVASFYCLSISQLSQLAASRYYL